MFHSYRGVSVAYRSSSDMNYHAVWLHLAADSLCNAGKNPPPSPPQNPQPSTLSSSPFAPSFRRLLCCPPELRMTSPYPPTVPAALRFPLAFECKHANCMQPDPYSQSTTSIDCSRYSLSSWATIMPCYPHCDNMTRDG